MGFIREIKKLILIFDKTLFGNQRANTCHYLNNFEYGKPIDLKHSLLKGNRILIWICGSKQSLIIIVLNILLLACKSIYYCRN